MTGLTLDLHLTGDLANILASLDLAGRNFDGDYGRGWLAALQAVALAVGAINVAPESERWLAVASVPQAAARERICPNCGGDLPQWDRDGWTACLACKRHVWVRSKYPPDDYGPGAFAAFK